MLHRAVVFAGAIAISSAAQYKWQPNNDWSRKSNWESGDGGGAVNLNVDCINNFGSGGEIMIDQAMTVGSIDLPMNGEITFNGDIELTFNGDVATTSEWRCKSPTEMSSACPSNYLVFNGSVDVIPDEPPCTDDTIWINGDEAQSIIFAPGQYVRDVQYSTAAEGIRTFALESDIEAHFATHENTRYIGVPPEVGQSIASARCLNTCPVHNLANSSLTGEDRWSLEGQRELNRTIALRDSIVAAQDRLTDLVQNEALLRKLNDMQNNYIADLGLDTTQFDELPIKEVTIPPFTAGGLLMGEWMEMAGMSGDEVDIIKYSTTKEVSDRAIVGLHALGNDPEQRWATMLNSEAVAAQAVAQLQTDDTAGKASATGIVAQATPVRASATEQLDTETALAYSALTLAAVTSGPISSLKFTSSDGWGKTTSSSIVESQSFSFSPGGFKFEGVTAAMKVMNNSEGEEVPAIAPVVYQSVLSASAAQITLFTEKQVLDEQIGRVQNLTTEAPAQASAAEDDGNMLMFVGIAAVALLLIICIVVALMMGGGDDKGSSGDNRNVVAFENPMYDDPSGEHDHGASDVGGLYDEPAFNSEKENPAFENSDGGGYLDVEPDEDEEDE